MPLRQDGSGGTRSARPPTSIPPERTSHYIELDGTTGRDAYFRPERYPRSELGAIGVLPLVAPSGTVHRCELRDVPQNGLGFEWTADAPPELVTSPEEISARFDGHEAYRGRAQVCSLRHEAEATPVGVSLADNLMSIEDVIEELTGVNPFVALSRA